MVAIGIAIFALCALSFFLLVLSRAKHASAYYHDLQNQTMGRAVEDIRNERDWIWRYEMLWQIEYDKMSWQFWRPFESFIPNKSFLTDTHPPEHAG